MSQRVGDYRVTVFTSPTPVRAGPVDVSVLVQDAATGETVSGARVTVRAARPGTSSGGVPHHAAPGAATNKLLQAVEFELPAPGQWVFKVEVEGDRGRAECRFALEAAEPLPRWMSVWTWIAWPALPILLFAVHQFLVRRKTRDARNCGGPAGEPGPAAARSASSVAHP
ncbi:MAG TPA: hypothetical protein VIL46_07880 [Gemmataceae bacterium]